MAKLEFPKYSSNDPTEWFSKVYQFFAYQNTPEAQKTVLASFHLEGEANQWWQWLHKAYKEERRTVTWAVFEEELWARFEATECEDSDEALSWVRQVGSLRDYQQEFERLGNRVHGWTQKVLVGIFMGGLKLEISDGIRMFKPKTLKEAISLARMRANQLLRQRKFTQPVLTNRLPNAMLGSTPVKRLTWDEMQKRRTQRLCFNCPEKFSAGHKCKGPQLLLLEGSSSRGGFGCEEIIDEATTETTIMEQTEPEISLHALTGWIASKTMRVMAMIGPHEFSVLVDSGSTHNFISEKVTSLLRLPFIPSRAFTVRVANGSQLQCEGRFEHVYILLQGIPFSLTFYSLTLTGLDLVLGVQWLELLGSVIYNWKEMTMDFEWEN